MRWSLLKDRTSLKPEAAADLDAWVARMRTMRAARAWLYKERLREILGRQQIDVVRDMFWHWCTCVLRTKVEPMKEVAALPRRYRAKGPIGQSANRPQGHRATRSSSRPGRTRQTNGFL